MTKEVFANTEAMNKGFKHNGQALNGILGFFIYIFFFFVALLTTSSRLYIANHTYNCAQVETAYSRI
jgi:hypothetical protein